MMHGQKNIKLLPVLLQSVTMSHIFVSTHQKFYPYELNLNVYQRGIIFIV
jgi:hypothetical protein